MTIHQRMAALALLSGLFALTPAWRQVFGLKGPVPQWRMFSMIYLDQCEVAFYTRQGDVDTRVDRLATLGHVPWTDAPRDVLLLKNAGAVRSQAKALCAALPPGTDLRAFARCATFHGWNPLYDRQDDLCVAKASP